MALGWRTDSWRAREDVRMPIRRQKSRWDKTVCLDKLLPAKRGQWPASGKLPKGKPARLDNGSDVGV